MSRTIDFQEFARLIDSSDAVIFDYNAVTYPYVEQAENEDGDVFYTKVEINYTDEYDTYEYAFYADCDGAIIKINDEGSLDYHWENSFNIQVLHVVKLV